VKFSGIAIPTFTLDKNDRLVRSTKRMSVSKKIAQRKSKRVSVKRGKRAPE
jgi:hypothetical protein